MELTIIYDGPRHPALNMALDEAMLKYTVATGRPLLRIYEWIPTGVSLGRSQPITGVNMEAIRDRGYVLVRRPTGGRALLHAQGSEVTYSITIPPDTRLAGMSVEESAATIAEGVALGLRMLGVDAKVGGFSGVVGEENLCLLRPGASDIIVNGVKVSGSAQLRFKGGLLQHGSILLDADPREWVSVIRAGVTGKYFAGLRNLGYMVDRLSLYNAIARGIARVVASAEDVAVRVQPGGLPVEVVEEAWSLYGKHTNTKWVMEARF